MLNSFHFKMLKNLSKRAIEGRKWRVSAREKRKFNTVVSKYIEQKHREIYGKCKKFYDDVVDKYPTVQNLTKTEEFRFFLTETASDSHEQTVASGIASDNNEKTVVRELL